MELSLQHQHAGNFIILNKRKYITYLLGPFISFSVKLLFLLIFFSSQLFRSVRTKTLWSEISTSYICRKKTEAISL